MGQAGYDVILNSFGNNKIAVIKVIREVTGLGLKEAKDLVDRAPQVVKAGVGWADAETIKSKLEIVGASVSTCEHGSNAYAGNVQQPAAPYAVTPGYAPAIQGAQPPAAAPYVASAGNSGAAAMPNAAAGSKKSNPIKYGIIAGAVVLALIVAAFMVPIGDESTGGSSDGGSDGDSGASSGALAGWSQEEFEGIYFTVPSSWEKDDQGDYISFSDYEGDGWSDVTLYPRGENDSFDAESELEWMVAAYNSTDGSSEVLESRVMTIDGQSAAYMEAVFRDDDYGDTFFAECLVCTPEGNLIDVTGMCTDKPENRKNEIRDVMDSITF